MQVEVRHLRAFVAVAEELNFTRAAERLHLAQQALSSQIQQLEQPWTLSSSCARAAASSSPRRGMPCWPRRPDC